MPDITISLTAGQATRVAAAIGKHLQLGRDATLQEATTFLTQVLKNVVKQEETKAAIEQISVTDL